MAIVGAATSWTDLTSTICAIVAVTIGLPALAANYEQLRLARRAALAELRLTLTSYIQRWNEPDMVETRTRSAQLTAEQLRDAVVDAYTRGADGDTLSYFRVPDYFENLGFAEHQGAFPRGALTAALGSLPAAAWDHWRPAVTWLRDHLGNDSVYSEFKRLADEASAHRPSR